MGIFELNLNQANRRGSNRAINNDSVKEFTPEFLHKAATFSWVSVLIGFLMLFILLILRVPGIFIGGVIIYGCVLILSFILGAVALFGVRKHGKRGILIPALIGVISSGLLILILVISPVFTLFYVTKVVSESRLHSESGQTNAVSHAQ